MIIQLLIAFLNCSIVLAAGPECKNLASAACASKAPNGSRFLTRPSSDPAVLARNRLRGRPEGNSTTQKVVDEEALNLINADPQYRSFLLEELVDHPTVKRTCAKPNNESECNIELGRITSGVFRKQLEAVGIKGANRNQNTSLFTRSLILDDPRVQSALVKIEDRVSQLPENIKTRESLAKSLFPTIKETMQSFINDPSNGIPADKKSVLLAKLQRVGFETSQNCVKNPDHPGRRLADKFNPDSMYVGLANPKVQICPGLFNYAKDPATQAAIIAHELSHSLDPCEIAADGKAIDGIPKYPNLKALDAAHPMGNVLQCLRSNNSIGARNMQIKTSKKASPEKVEALHSCGTDQVTEGFADWMSAEILAKLLKSGSLPGVTDNKMAVLSSFRYYCSDSKSHKSDDVHPSGVARINGILGTQPAIRELLGCPAKHPLKNYCSLADSGPSAVDKPQSAVAPANQKGSRR